MNKGTLFVVATPIGNLEDITLRALSVLKSVDGVLAEDTRVTKKLLDRYEIKKPVLRCDAKMEKNIAGKIVSETEKGKNFALVTDAGTPNVSDPGARIVEYIRNNAPSIKIVPIPGSSSLTAFLSVSGTNGDRFTFLGYPPHKKGRKTFFDELEKISVRPVIFFESTHRLKKCFGEIERVYGAEKQVVVGKELTKIHEEIFRGTVEDAISHFSGEREKGEFLILLE